MYVDEVSAKLNVDAGAVGSNSAFVGGGVYVRYGSATLSGTQVVSNSASYNGGGLYLSSSTGAITATDGCVVYNSDTAVDNNSTGTLNATDNWWGMADGPSGVGPGSGDSVSANVDYANFKTSPPPGCPPYVDLTIVKAVAPTIAAPGDAITYTLAFSSTDPGLATGVVITDGVPISVTRGSLGYVSSGAAITATGSISYVWNVEDLSMHEGGVIVITGVLSGSLSAGPFTNTATIASGAAESSLGNNVAVVALCVTLPHDLDRDGDVDVGDIMQVAARWRCALGDGCYDARYDFDGDGQITVVDIMRVAGRWGDVCP